MESPPPPPNASSSPRPKILLLNGPNLNLLGVREPGIYGSTTLPDITSSLTARAPALGLSLTHFQSNHEGHLVDRIQAAILPPYSPANPEVAAIIINPAAYTHTSVALRDALGATGIPFIELHISNVHAREEWRHKSYFTDKAEAIIAGLGAYGYVAALEYWAWKLQGGRQKGIAVETAAVEEEANGADVKGGKG